MINHHQAMTLAKAWVKQHEDCLPLLCGIYVTRYTKMYHGRLAHIYVDVVFEPTKEMKRFRLALLVVKDDETVVLRWTRTAAVEAYLKVAQYTYVHIPSLLGPQFTRATNMLIDALSSGKAKAPSWFRRLRLDHGLYAEVTSSSGDTIIVPVVAQSTAPASDESHSSTRSAVILNIADVSLFTLDRVREMFFTQLGRMRNNESHA